MTSQGVSKKSETTQTGRYFHGDVVGLFAPFGTPKLKTLYADVGRRFLFAPVGHGWKALVEGCHYAANDAVACLQCHVFVLHEAYKGVAV